MTIKQNNAYKKKRQKRSLANLNRLVGWALECKKKLQKFKGARGQQDPGLGKFNTNKRAETT